ncbi:hypothetical protein HMPREF1370_01402 [Enterococcus faecium P1123]|nr:hypothetical protein HMPREF9524_01191 [Enterococcus faecium TX0133a01]EFR71389.1 hypothetical protein HMPREF9526_01579 [Enterococcus faecium TX0133B]EFR74971.1 hypothetical protein HMPREF9523_01105 [Enterococcus faecium TX0133A]EFR77346.1 hypothetical protein HMPREF9527_01840 [Enterococcus faecium TX0133C]EFS06664.1 hypothetical protein HMPREF9525_01229 [Enterococcus faecium TX0133a04]EJX75978.1 hypothetical protein HMPREF1372_01909 [Enterococcus faecium P1139]EJX81688.1 hypothetical prote
MQIFGIGLVFSMYGSFCVYPTLASSLASSEIGLVFFYEVMENV